MHGGPGRVMDPSRCPASLPAKQEGLAIMTTGSDGVSRRDIFRTAAAGGIALALAPGTAMAQAGAGSADAAPISAATVTGIVFDDTAGDGSRKPDSRGIPGVLVSNGREIAVTDIGGHYSLPVGDETVVFVIKPSGYMTPLEPGTMLPRFHYIHQPNGSPASLDLTFAGIAPTGPLPASVDFPLRRQDEPKSFEVVLFTDPQPETDVEVDFIREDVLAPLRGTRARFGMTLGDLMFDDLSLYGRYNALVGTIGLPWYNIGGNHDLNFEAPDRRQSRETFKRVFGPSYYAFHYADAVFVMLDDVDYLGTDRTKPHGAGKYEGRLDPAQLDFVRNLLAHVPDDKLIVLTLHIPLATYLSDNSSENLTDRAELFKILAGRRYTLSLSGHTHTTEHHYFGEAEGFVSPVPHHHHILTAVSGSWWSGPFDHRGVAVADSRDGTPNGFHILSVEGNRYTTRFVPAKEPEGRQIRVSVESQFHGEMRRDTRPGTPLQPRLSYAAARAATVVANVFDGGPKTVVSLKIGDAAPVAMVPRGRPDPFVEDVYARNEATKKPWVKAETSSHVWTARLPPLGPGIYPMVVEAVNEYGATVSTRQALELEG